MYLDLEVHPPMPPKKNLVIYDRIQIISNILYVYYLYVIYMMGKKKFYEFNLPPYEYARITMIIMIMAIMIINPLGSTGNLPFMRIKIDVGREK